MSIDRKRKKEKEKKKRRGTIVKRSINVIDGAHGNSRWWKRGIETPVRVN